MEIAELMKEMNAKCLIALPNSGASKLASLYSNYNRQSNELTILTHSSAFLSKFEEFDTENVGLMLSHPITRLIDSYRAFKATPGFNQTFEAFYAEPQRVNFYSRVLAGVELSSLGYVAITEAFFKAVLLLEGWCGGEYYRIPYGALIDKKDTFELDEKTLNEINSLYRDDILLYERAKLIFEEKWHTYLQKVKLDIAASKQLYVHLGPPKTGTSALQLWLNQSVTELSEKGIDYPKHGTDINDVSSGNFDQIISADTDRNQYFDDQKAKSMVSSFNCSSYNLLLLSSEHFFYYLPWFFTRLPSANYIFYVRHPIPSVESNYHQEVKRHGHTSAFKLPKKIDFNHLKIVSEMAMEFGVTITYRYFSEATFEGGTLYTDFRACIPQFIDVPAVSRKLNTQFSAGALELMRKANRIADQDALKQLDFFLQKVSEDKPNFSLISPNEIERLKRELESSVESIVLSNPQLDINKLKKLLESFKPSPFCKEDDILIDFNKVLSLLKREKPLLALTLYKQAQGHEKNDWAEKLKPSKLSLLWARSKGFFRG